MINVAGLDFANNND